MFWPSRRGHPRPDTLPEPGHQGRDPLPPEGVRRILHPSSDLPPATAAGFSPARRVRRGGGVPGLYSIAWIPDQLRSFEPGCPPVEGVEGHRSGPSCDGRHHQVEEVSSALAVSAVCARDVAGALSKSSSVATSSYTPSKRGHRKTDRLARGPSLTLPSPRGTRSRSAQVSSPP